LVVNLDPDGWLHVIELLGGGAFATKMLRVLLEMRDSLKDLGEKEPPSGLFRTVSEQALRVDKHETWLVQLRAKLGMDGVIVHTHQRETDEH